MVKDGIYLGKRYEVLSKIGAGGMADVYKGKDHMLNRYVAIKVLKKEYKEDDNFVRKFRSEAQAAAGLMNPNIVNVYDVGEDRGLYYMVMELVEGITLKDYIEKKGRLSHKEVISIAIQMCTGIGAAHNANIIHRDIKPQNIIISRDGKVKVTDFGIAKATTSNTISSNAMGSVHYTSPEQARGGFSDAKSDVYSIGITLFEMATGEVPFDGESTVAVAIKHLQEEITPPSELVPDIPYSLEQIILKCTQKNAERRYASTTELIQDLKRSLVDPDGDFVVIPPLRNADTVIITDEELDDIRSSYDEEELDEDDYEYDEDEYDDDEYGGDEYDDDEYGDGEYDDDDDEYGGKDGKRGRRGKNSDEVNPRMNKIMKILTIVVVVIIVFILIFTIGKAAGIFKFGPKMNTEETDTGKVKVPDVVGMTEDDAKAALKKKGLGMKVVARKESKKYEKGTVSEQKTEAGKKVKKNSTVEVVVSSDLVGDEITVPDVSGMSEADAQKALEDEGLKVGSSEFVYDDNVAEGDVIGTTPSANAKVTKDTEIIMKVSKGSEKKTVPDIRGMSESAARTALSDAGLNVGTVTYDYNDSVEKGNVVSQSLNGGKKVSKGTTVDFAVSSGKKPEEKISVPNVIGAAEYDARQRIQNAGLSVGTVSEEESDRFGAGVVIRCEPGAGTSVSKGTKINLVISRAPQQPPAENPGDSDSQ
ncbi:Stk1 family PASTA domain-containing Ser/Thr kinase [[Clostridium] hylemonae]|uniref:Stk1 family PASTA domain-containing Ser/Thr kinase n=1 Tax=[Clostridium] hylemonae TaxID=89153 RepID=UPI001FCAB4B0|nr:Stk1 family PASTA domain-containing Ser/Thr kinase [[Clostridium] hylemonae]BDF05677.1 protein kinase [[Clostridium] hylemonae]